MKIKLISAFILLLSFQICIAQKNDGKISWDKERPLTWKDFKGRPDNSSPFDALTHGATLFRISNVSGNDYKLILTVDFESKSSWVKSKKDTDKLLAHEQLHFDLFEVYARLFIREIEESKILSKKNYIDKVQKIYKDTFSELSNMQQKYDKETNHSKNEEKQKEWSDQIHKMLEDNKDFAKRELLYTDTN